MKIIKNGTFHSASELDEFMRVVHSAVRTESEVAKLVALRVELETGLKNANFKPSITQEANLVLICHELNMQIEKMVAGRARC